MQADGSVPKWGLVLLMKITLFTGTFGTDRCLID